MAAFAPPGAMPAFLSAPPLPSLRGARRGALSPARPPAPARIVASAQGGDLRRRMASVRTAEKLIDAMRLVAAARIRASTDAALAARPFADRLQAQLRALVHNIRENRTDVAGVAAAARHDAFVVLSGNVTVDRVAQRALMDRLNVCLLDMSAEAAAAAASASLAGDPVRRSLDSALARREGHGAAPPPVRGGVATTLLVVFTADRGFCGSYNKDVLTRAMNRIRTIEASHPERRVELVLVGKAAVNFFTRRHPEMPVRFATDVGKPSEIADATARVCDSVLSYFIADEYERVEVVYTRFTSLVSNTASVRTLLPVTPSGLEVADDEIFQLTSRNGKLFVAPMEVDASPSVAVAAGLERMLYSDEPPSYAISEEGSILLLNAMLPMYVHSQLARMLRDSVAAELSSRMNAMNAATDNCKDISKSLKSKFDKERQSRITSEVIMIAGFPR